MALLEKSLLPGVVFAGYVTRPSRRSRRILRPSRKKTSVNTTRPPAGIVTARSRPACALMGTILPVECPPRPLSGGDASRSPATARLRQARHPDSVSVDDALDDPAVAFTLFTARRQQWLDKRLDVGQVLGT